MQVGRHVRTISEMVPACRGATRRQAQRNNFTPQYVLISTYPGAYIRVPR